MPVSGSNLKNEQWTEGGDPRPQRAERRRQLSSLEVGAPAFELLWVVGGHVGEVPEDVIVHLVTWVGDGDDRGGETLIVTEREVHEMSLYLIITDWKSYRACFALSQCTPVLPETGNSSTGIWLLLCCVNRVLNTGVKGKNSAHVCIDTHTTHTLTQHIHFTCCSARYDGAGHTLQAAETIEPSQWTGDISTQTHAHAQRTAHGPHGVINN